MNDEPFMLKLTMNITQKYMKYTIIWKTFFLFSFLVINAMSVPIREDRSNGTSDTKNIAARLINVPKTSPVNTR